MSIPTPPAEPTAQDAPASSASNPKQKRMLVLAATAVGALLVGGVAGWGVTASQMAPQITELQKDNRDVSSDLAKMTKLHDQLAEEQDQVISEYTDKLADLTTDEAAVQAREDAVKAREDKVAIVEASSFTAGVLMVGTDVAPGVYRTSGVSDCYYAWKRGTGSDADIIDNNIADGTATVTLKQGDVFESSSRCGTWTKIG